MADLEHGLTIHELELAETISGDSFVAIDDGTNTKKAKIANLNSASATTAQTYAQAAAASAAASASSATQAQTSAQSIQSAMVQATSQLQGYVDDAAASASSAAASEANIRGLITSDYAKLARSYATGDSGYREGEETDNAKYYSEQSESYVDDAEAQAVIAGQKADLSEDYAEESEDHALESEGHALGTQNGTPVSSDSPYYHNNAKYWADEARQSSAGGVAASVIATAEPTNISSHAYAIGDQFVYNGILYTATSAISVGATITPGTNCSISDTITEQIGNAGHTILDEDGTTYPQRSKLQFEGCEVTDDAVNGITVVKCEGGGGSKISISTNETTLYGKTVTVTGTSETKTATIGNDGKAVIDGFIDTGSVTISASDGTETASVTISIPYFGNYTVSLSFWAATLSISTDSPDLYGQTITVKDSNNQTVATATMSAQGACTATVSATGTYTVSAVGDGVTVTESVSVSAQTTYNVSLHLWTATVSISTSSSELYSATITVKKGGSTVGTTSFSAQGAATYNAHETGTYTFECTYSGQTYYDSVTVSAETSYSATINTGLMLSAWLTAGNVTGTYADFSEVEADEQAVRKLMTIHAAVDYLATCASATDSLALSIINSDICAKWINLRDYALDTLYANTYLASMMDTADKYFYGEWVITDSTTTPPTWGPKGNVPIMTSNSAPYGTASAYQVFDGNASTSASGTDFSYKFTNPVCVRKFDASVNGGSLQGSNDGSTWENVIPASNTAYYLYYRVHYASSQTVNTLQFYGRTLKVSVPVMTSNTAPYGEASANAEYSANHAAYKAFDNDSSTECAPHSSSNQLIDHWIKYDFGRKVLVKEIKFYQGGTNAPTRTYRFQGSNDGITWTDISDSYTSEAYEGVFTEKNKHLYSVNPNNTLFSQYRVFIPHCITWVQGEYSWGVGAMNFYALDYSEYDWDTNHPRKYLYDHGVELEIITEMNTTNTGSTSKENAYYKYSMSNGNGVHGFFTSSLDLTSYNLERTHNETVLVKATDAGTNYGNIGVVDTNPSVDSIAQTNTYSTSLPYNGALDISSVNGSHKCWTGIYTGSLYTMQGAINEWWLE